MAVTDWGGANSRFLGLVFVGSTIIRSNGIETVGHPKNPSNDVKYRTHALFQPLFQDLSILPLEKLVLYRIALIKYKMSNGLIPKTMSDLNQVWYII